MCAPLDRTRPLVAHSELGQGGSGGVFGTLPFSSGPLGLVGQVDHQEGSKRFTQRSKIK